MGRNNLMVIVDHKMLQPWDELQSVFQDYQTAKKQQAASQSLGQS